MNTFFRLVTTSMIAAAALVTGSVPIGCGDEASRTSGRRIALDVAIEASPDSRQFTNAKGWSVTLTEAIVATGAFYFYDGETLFAGAAPRGRSWARGFVKTAFAHPGHYVPGEAKGEMLTPWSADVLAGATIGSGEGVTGFVRSATFGFGAPASGPLAAELGENVIVLEGTATKDAELRAFRAELTPSEVANTKGLPQIEGCPFVITDMERDGTVTITVKLSMWFDQVDFAGVPKSDGEAPVLLGDGLAKNQLVRGTKAGLAYSFAYAPR